MTSELGLPVKAEKTEPGRRLSGSHEVEVTRRTGALVLSLDLSSEKLCESVAVREGLGAGP